MSTKTTTTTASPAPAPPIAPSNVLLVNTPSILYFTLCRYAQVAHYEQLERIFKLTRIDATLQAEKAPEDGAMGEYIGPFMDDFELKAFSVLLRHDPPPPSVHTLLYEQLIRPLFAVCADRVQTRISATDATLKSECESALALELRSLIHWCAYRLNHSSFGVYLHLYGGWHMVFQHESEPAMNAPRTPACMPTSMSLLSDAHILAHISRGNIVIEPFRPAFLGTTSYDVTLGPHYYASPLNEKTSTGGGGVYYNMYDHAQVEKAWGPVRTAEVVPKGRDLLNVGKDDKVIWIGPGQTFLCHTNEFVGGLHCVNTMMKARSSFGRNFLSICKCAGWGDIGYINRWTMEITNHSLAFTIPLVVGRRIAQIVFFATDSTIGNRQYNSKYQATQDLSTIMRNWRPEQMLPRLSMDVV